MTHEEEEKYAIDHILNDKIVSHEFVSFFLGNFIGSAFNLLMEKGMTNKMRKAKWNN